MDSTALPQNLDELIAGVMIILTFVLLQLIKDDKEWYKQKSKYRYCVFENYKMGIRIFKRLSPDIPRVVFDINRKECVYQKRGHKTTVYFEDIKYLQVSAPVIIASDGYTNVSRLELVTKDEKTLTLIQYPNAQSDDLDNLYNIQKMITKQCGIPKKQRESSHRNTTPPPEEQFKTALEKVLTSPGGVIATLTWGEDKNYSLQILILEEGQIHFEAVGNEYLPANDQLTTEQMNFMKQSGWKINPLSKNYCQDIDIHRGFFHENTLHLLMETLTYGYGFKTGEPIFLKFE